ncbi:MAG: hypothetical protein HZC41_11570 [Chloroflexi bacterium]|nr:hypothetical protein [Chloroflexota bacterium]
MNLWRRLFGSKPRVIRQRKWTEAELRAQGFRYYASRKQVTMVRRLPPEEAPKVIKTPWDTIVAQAGYYIAYQTNNPPGKPLDAYEPRPIEPRIFKETYARWREPNWKPSPTEAHLMKLGCKPYYKTVGVWAKRLTEPTYVQSLESDQPTLAPAGAWLCVGSAGEPWTVTDEWFRRRYVMPGKKPGQKPAPASAKGKTPQRA